MGRGGRRMYKLVNGRGLEDGFEGIIDAVDQAVPA